PKLTRRQAAALVSHKNFPAALRATWIIFALLASNWKGRLSHPLFGGCDNLQARFRGYRSSPAQKSSYRSTRTYSPGTYSLKTNGPVPIILVSPGTVGCGSFQGSNSSYFSTSSQMCLARNPATLYACQ